VKIISKLSLFNIEARREKLGKKGKSTCENEGVYGFLYREKLPYTQLLY